MKEDVIGEQAARFKEKRKIQREKIFQEIGVDERRILKWMYETQYRKVRFPINPTQNRNQWLAFVNTKMNFLVA
jgi:hypothetical protein